MSSQKAEPRATPRATPWATVKEAADYYRKTPKTFLKLLKSGFPHVRTSTGSILVNLDQGDRYLLDKHKVKDKKKAAVLLEVLS